MKDFSIKHLENFSGIKAHTIRVWEQRFGILQPNRSKSNIRHYSLNDVKLLLNTALLVKNGFKISELAGKDHHSIATKIRQLTADKARREKVVSQLIICMYSHDIEQFDDILDSCFVTWGVDITLQELILPFLEKVKLLSYHDSSCEAHFAITAIRRKIILGLERVHSNIKSNKSALLFLAEGEHYDLMLLFISYILKKNGIKVWYLGTNISKDNLGLILSLKKPDYLFTYIPHKQKFKEHAVIPYINKYLTETNFVVVSCEQKSAKLEIDPHVSFIHYNDVEIALK
ncbi:MAG: MerR family transcriptional regulator [Chitinophagaceae bacterium]|nr:MerR family transcriptional regulator [Chitinophagaceae bacterium]